MWNIYPYTNFHELNADWILQKIKEIYKDNKSLSETVKLSTALLDEKLKNVDDDIKKILENMIETGELESIIANTIVPLNYLNDLENKKILIFSLPDVVVSEFVSCEVSELLVFFSATFVVSELKPATAFTYVSLSFRVLLI